MDHYDLPKFAASRLRPVKTIHTFIWVPSLIGEGERGFGEELHIPSLNLPGLCSWSQWGLVSHSTQLYQSLLELCEPPKGEEVQLDRAGLVEMIMVSCQSTYRWLSHKLGGRLARLFARYK